MKSLLITLILIVLSILLLEAQRPAVDFYRKHKRLENVQNFKIPGWLMWFGTGIAYDIVKNEEVKSALKIARKVKKMRLMIAEDNNPIPVADVSNFVSESRRNGFDDLIYVRDGETVVNIIGRVKKDKFKELVFMVSEEDEFVFFHLKSNIRMKDIQELINNFMTDFPINDKTRKEQKEKTKREKRKKEKVPVA